MSGCSECERMVRLYGEASARHAVAEQELARYRSTESEGDFSRLWEACEYARKDHEQERQALLLHLAGHR